MPSEQDKETFTPHQAALLLKISHVTVIEWVEKGFLKATRPPRGGHSIRRRDLQSFLELHQLPIPHELRRPSGIRILIVDDEPDARLLLQQAILAAFSACSVEIAEDGFEAGTKVITYLPDLVVLDLKLPGVHGYKVCQQIKSDPHTRHIKILAVSGMSADEAGFRSRAEGADGFVPKPVDIEKFQREAARLLGLSVFEKSP